MEKISSAIALTQVDLETKINGLKTILEGIYTLYTKLCDVDFFIQETQQQVKRLQAELRASRTTMNTILGNSQLHFKGLKLT